MDQLAFPVHTLSSDLVASLRATVGMAFPEAGDYALAFCDMDSVACFWSTPEPLILFHQIFDHPDTPLFVFESILAHECCHLVQRLRGIPRGHGPDFWALMDQRMGRELRARSDQWLDDQLGPCLHVSEDFGLKILRAWRKHYLRSRDSLFDWRDQQNKAWSMQRSRHFKAMEGR